MMIRRRPHHPCGSLTSLVPGPRVECFSCRDLQSKSWWHGFSWLCYRVDSVSTSLFVLRINESSFDAPPNSFVRDALVFLEGSIVGTTVSSRSRSEILLQYCHELVFELDLDFAAHENRFRFDPSHEYALVLENVRNR